MTAYTIVLLGVDESFEAALMSEDNEAFCSHYSFITRYLHHHLFTFWPFMF